MDLFRNHIFVSLRGPNPLAETTDRVIGAIKARLLSPGERLPPERDLALQLGVSRSTLRVVLQNLIDDGWLEVRRGRNGGSFVMRWPENPNSDMIEQMRAQPGETLTSLLDYRRAVECMATTCAAERATTEEIDEIQALTDAIVATGLESLAEFRAYDTRFHAAISYASHSPRLMEAVTEVQTALSEVLDATIFYTADQLADIVQQHNTIVDAIRARDVTLAQEEMMHHLVSAEATIRRLHGG